MEENVEKEMRISVLQDAPVHYIIQDSNAGTREPTKLFSETSDYNIKRINKKDVTVSHALCNDNITTKYTKTVLDTKPLIRLYRCFHKKN